MEEFTYKFKKLHITLPDKLFYAVKDKGIFFKIDEVVCKLLIQYLEELEEAEETESGE